MELQQAISVVTKANNDDPALFYAYQSAIAVPFQDEVRRNGVHISREKLHEISNNAAKQFLQTWVGQKDANQEEVGNESPVAIGKKAGKTAK